MIITMPVCLAPQQRGCRAKPILMQFCLCYCGNWTPVTPALDTGMSCCTPCTVLLQPDCCNCPGLCIHTDTSLQHCARCMQGGQSIEQSRVAEDLLRSIAPRLGPILSVPSGFLTTHVRLCPCYTHKFVCKRSYLLSHHMGNTRGATNTCKASLTKHPDSLLAHMNALFSLCLKQKQESAREQQCHLAGMYGRSSRNQTSGFLNPQSRLVTTLRLSTFVTHKLACHCLAGKND